MRQWKVEVRSWGKGLRGKTAVKTWSVTATITKTKRPEELVTPTNAVWWCCPPAQPALMPVQFPHSLSSIGRPDFLSLRHQESRWQSREVLLSPPNQPDALGSWSFCLNQVPVWHMRGAGLRFKARLKECKQGECVWRIIKGGGWQNSRNLERRKQRVRESISAIFNHASEKKQLKTQSKYPTNHRCPALTRWEHNSQSYECGYKW